MAENDLFKTCPGCFVTWESMEAFLADPHLELNGYKADFKELEYGMFFFTHGIQPCRSTMTLMVNDFKSLYTGKTYTENKALSAECPRYCIDEKQLARCDALCECAYVREIMQIILERQSAAKGCTA